VGLPRIFEETLRIDPSHHILGLRLSFFVAIALCLAGLGWFIHGQHGSRSARIAGRGAALLIAGVAATSVGGCRDDRGGSQEAASGNPTQVVQPENRPDQPPGSPRST
jgi:hypothetical protein